MTSKKALKAILIDLDGTLADTIPVLYETYLQFLSQKGEAGSREEFASLMGPTIPEVVSTLRQKYEWHETPEQLSQQYWSLLTTLYEDHLGLFPGAKEFLQHLKHHDVKIALVTAAARELVESFLRRHKIRSYFDCIVAGNDVVYGKPHPEAYQKALSILHIDPEDSLAVEDSHIGVLSARTAHIPTIQIRHSEKIPLIEGAHPLLNWDAILNYYRETYE